MADLHPLPAQPDGVPWPGDEWPSGEAPASVGLAARLDMAFDPAADMGQTLAVVVVHRGRLVGERYAHPDVGSDTTLVSWSMAKSVLHACVGILVRDGKLALEPPAPVPEWRDASDPRSAITLDDLLTMRDGLDFAEDYEDADRSDVIPMLFGDRRGDMAAFTASKPLAHAPGSTYNYSSGTSNIVSRIVKEAAGASTAADYEGWLRTQIFDRLGMASATLRFDDAGTWVASSFVYATARDYARFGLFALRDGVWEGERVLPAGWIDHGRLARSEEPDDERWHGAHWWAEVPSPLGTFWANGYEGQRIVCVPAADLVVVRLGRTPSEWRPKLDGWWRDLAVAFAEATA